MFNPQEPLFEIRLSSLEVIISSFVVREEPSEDAPTEKFSARSNASGEESHHLRQPAQTESTKPDCASMNQDESDHFPGDLLNGVGSASSTSTASSVFSSMNLNSAMALSNGIHLNAMTPLTNADSSSSVAPPSSEGDQMLPVLVPSGVC